MAPEEQNPLSRIEAKVDKVLALANQLLPQVVGHESDINYLRSSSKRNEVQIAVQDEKIKNVSVDVDQVGAKVRKNEKDLSGHLVDTSKHRSFGESFSESTARWRFIAASCAAIVGLSSAIAAIFPLIVKALGIE